MKKKQQNENDINLFVHSIQTVAVVFGATICWSTTMNKFVCTDYIAKCDSFFLQQQQQQQNEGNLLIKNDL